MHAHDYKKSSGGFVHGFRYLIQSQLRYIRLLRDRAWEGMTPFVRVEDAVRRGLERVQNSSGLYQMQGVLVDLFVHTIENTESMTPYIVHLSEVPEAWILEVLKELRMHPLSYCSLKFEYGKLPHADEWDFELTLQNAYARQSPPLFLHPVVTHSNGKQWKGREDLETVWVQHTLQTEVQAMLRTCLS